MNYLALWLCGFVTGVCSIIAKNDFWMGISCGIFISVLIVDALGEESGK